MCVCVCVCVCVTVTLSAILGTRPGGSDTVGFKAVGVAREAVLPSLSLQQGTTYYATVRGQCVAPHTSNNIASVYSYKINV